MVSYIVTNGYINNTILRFLKFCHQKLLHHMYYELSEKLFPKVLILSCFLMDGITSTLFLSACFSVSFLPWFLNEHILLSESEKKKPKNKTMKKNLHLKNGCYISFIFYISNQNRELLTKWQSQTFQSAHSHIIWSVRAPGIYPKISTPLSRSPQLLFNSFPR